MQGVGVAGTIFINYRRSENLKDAQHLATLLGKRFREKRIFLDNRGIEGGESWLHTLERQVAASDAMVVMIGKNWGEIRDEQGRRRLDHLSDFVRFEIAQAFVWGVPLLPVLLDGARMPQPAELPPNIMPLSYIQAMPLRLESVVQDAEAVARRLKSMLAKRRRGMPAWVVGVGAAFIFAAGVTAGPFVAGQLGLLAPPSENDLQRQLNLAKDEVAKVREDVARLSPAAHERDQARIELANASKKIDELQKIVDAANNDVAKARGEGERLGTAAQERDQARSELANANQKVVDLQNVADAANRDLVKAREEAERLRTAVQERDQARSALAITNQRMADLQKRLDASTRRVDETQKKVEGNVQRDPALAVTPGSSQPFRDPLVNGEPCALCPDMVVAPSGSFRVGSSYDEPERVAETESQYSLTIDKPIAVSKYAIMRGQFATFVNETGHKTDGGCFVFDAKEVKIDRDRSWKSPGFSQEDQHPIVCVSWYDAKSYVTWLSSKTGKAYRLVTEAEREYVTRAGTATPFWWGMTIVPSQASYDSRKVYKGGVSSSSWRPGTLAADSFAANPWGLHNVHGNVWEWTEDCWGNGYSTGGVARKSGDCNLRVVRGGSWINGPDFLRSASRRAVNAGIRQNILGFRVARGLVP
jgi:formylglycine-generating enzyme required for sulfatase activity